MALTNSIGSFTFISLEGEPGMVSQKVELMTLPYYNGEASRFMGKHCEPFELTSFVDQATISDARSKLKDYVDTIGTVKDLTWHGIGFPYYGQVQILDVRPRSITPARSIIGGLNVVNGYMLSAVWELRFVGV